MPQDKSNNKTEWLISARMYYEHQYKRMESIEDQAFKMSGVTFFLTAAAFAFVPHVGNGSSRLSSSLLLVLMLIGHVAALFYIWRVMDSIYVHEQRAKKILEEMSPSLSEVDGQYPQTCVGRVRCRQLIQLILHVFLVVAVVWVLSGR